MTNFLCPPRSKYPRFRSYFQKTPADYGDEVENLSVFRKQIKRALRNVSGSGGAVAAAGNDLLRKILTETDC